MKILLPVRNLVRPVSKNIQMWTIFFYVKYLADKTVSACLPRLPANDDFDRPTSPRVRFKELAQVWAIAHSLLLDRVCGTTYLSIYVTLNILSWSSSGYWRHTASVLLKTAAPSDCLLFERLIQLHLHYITLQVRQNFAWWFIRRSLENIWRTM